jgi:hypothetical protein
VGASLLIGFITSAYFGYRASQHAAEKTRAVDQLADVSSQLLVVADRLQQGKSRSAGYRQEISKMIEDTLRLGGANVDRGLLRQVAAGAMGDFVGLPAELYIGSSLGSKITAIGAASSGNHLALGLYIGLVHLKVGE